MREAVALAVMLVMGSMAKAEETPADALAALGPEGLSPRFIEENQTFIASGCVAPARICAKTAQDYALADLLTMMTMNEGMASTFVPFGCEN